MRTQPGSGCMLLRQTSRERPAGSAPAGNLHGSVDGATACTRELTPARAKTRSRALHSTPDLEAASWEPGKGSYDRAVPQTL